MMQCRNTYTVKLFLHLLAMEVLSAKARGGFESNQRGPQAYKHLLTVSAKFWHKYESIKAF